MRVQSLILAVAVSMPLSSALAQATAPRSTDEARAAVKLPGSAQEHLALAQDYEQKAAEWRKEAAFHRDMATAYAASHPDPKGGVRNAEAVKMENHCMAIVKDAEKLAAEAEWSVKYHRARAKELGH